MDAWDKMRLIVERKKASKESIEGVGVQLSKIELRIGVIEFWNRVIPSSVHLSLIVGRSIVGADGDSGAEEEGVYREKLVIIASCLLA